MSKALSERSGLELVQEMRKLTKEMFNKSEDAEALTALIEKRGALMEDYDRLKATNPRAAAAMEKDKNKIKKILEEMRELDKGVNASLEKMHAEAKLDLESTTSNQKVLGYTNQAIASSGSFMDIKN